MSYQFAGIAGSVDQTCHYEGSARRFRGPVRSLTDPFVACLGGDETFGRFVDLPYPAVLQQQLNRPCVNLGSLFCGVEAMTGDVGVRDILAQAEICVLQLPDVAGQSNAFYCVHPQRNDRFLKPTQRLVALYPAVDFTEIHFVRHLLRVLQERCSRRFETVLQALQEQWTSRMTAFLSPVKCPVVVLHLTYLNRLPEQDTLSDTLSPNRPEMLAALAPFVACRVEGNVNPSAMSDDLEDVLFGTMQLPIAEHVLGPATHRRIAEILVSAIRDLE